MKMFLRGEWVDRPEKIQVVNPFDGSLIDTVPQASAEDIDQALEARARGGQDHAEAAGL